MNQTSHHRPNRRRALSSTLRALLLVALCLPLVPQGRAEDRSLHPELERFRPLLGRTWKGEFKNSTPEKRMVDVSRWERALNGQALRVLHSVNQGDYGGETLVFWSDEKKSIAYFYVTTAGFQTSGTMTFDGSKFTSLEKVSGQSGGITEVRATGELRADRTLLIKAEYLKDNQWLPGRETVYHEDPAAEVIFR